MNNKIRLLFFISILFVQNISFAVQESRQTLKDGLIAELHEQVDKRHIDSELFHKAISNQSIDIQLTAIKGLGRIGSDGILTLVTPLLENKNEKIRRAAAFSLGISGSEKASKILWSALEIEHDETVKQEIYLGLCNLAGDNLVLDMLARQKQEQNIKTRSTIFQGLSTAITNYKNVSDQIDMSKSQNAIDFTELLELFERDDELSYHVGYFLARVKKIQKQLNPAQLQRFIYLIKSTNNKKMFARLIGKITKNKHLANRKLLSWLIEHSEVADVSLATEATRAMETLLYIPQTQIQLGKLQASSNLQVAQTALQALANSSLSGLFIKNLLKKKLKSEHPALVVEAMSGLIKRQKREDMSWALKILTHKNAYVKIKFAQLIADKDKDGFKNVLIQLSKDKEPSVANYAKNLLSEKKEKPTTKKLETIPFEQAKKSIGKKIALHTSVGDIVIQLNDQAIYSAANFERLISEHFYDGSYFSRVIGNFVAQGGDTIGDVEGSSSQTIREEISFLSHLTGTVGMATSGKDTGSSQFFINIGNNVHLDRKYTIFGNVIQGMENVYKLSNGDQIISAEVMAE